MFATLLADVHFHELLLAIDRDLAEACRGGGCACGGVLLSACYPRKPRGRPKAVACRLGREPDLRFLFCCAVDGCRGRGTPPSMRFRGRRVYVAAIVVMIAILRSGVTDARVIRLNEIVSVDRRTVGRWWRETFVATPFWRIARARFMPPRDLGGLPMSLLDRFSGDEADRMTALLRFLGPLTGGTRMQAR